MYYLDNACAHTRMKWPDSIDLNNPNDNEANYPETNQVLQTMYTSYYFWGNLMALYLAFQVK